MSNETFIPRVPKTMGFKKEEYDSNILYIYKCTVPTTKYVSLAGVPFGRYQVVDWITSQRSCKSYIYDSLLEAAVCINQLMNNQPVTLKGIQPWHP